MEDEDFAAAVVAQLGRRTLATAESCTAGRISQTFAAVGDAVRWFRGGVVAYQPGVKHDVLSVASSSVLSEMAAAEMATGVARLLSADVTVATTGLVGDEAQDGVAPGTIFVATSVDGEVRTRTHHFEGDAQAVVAAAVRQALGDLLLDLAPPPTPLPGEPTS
jgi:nicotinamide-nucleotide amidase